jgi:hypothetical protein
VSKPHSLVGCPRSSASPPPHFAHVLGRSHTQAQSAAASMVRMLDRVSTHRVVETLWFLRWKIVRLYKAGTGVGAPLFLWHGEWVWLCGLLIRLSFLAGV